MGASNAMQILTWRAWRRGVAVLVLLLLATMTSRNHVEGWEWLMADTLLPVPTCPGRCLQVNDSKTPGYYQQQVVGFAECRTTSPNQQWMLDGDQSIVITIVEPSTLETRCLEPLWYTDPSSLNVVVVACTDSPRQKWVIDEGQAVVRTEQSIGSGPEPLYLTLNYTKVLQDDNPKSPWYASFLASAGDALFYNQPPNQTKVVMVVPGASSFNASAAASRQLSGQGSGNLILNGGFELSSYLDDRPTVMSVELSGDTNDLFGLCYWTVVQGAVQIYSAQSSGVESEGSLSVLLNGQFDTGTVSQVIPTKPGSFYMMVFSMAAQIWCPNTSLATVQVLVSPSSVEFRNFSIPGSGEEHGEKTLDWHTFGFGLQALSEATNISFQSLTAPQSGCGPSIDNVQVILGSSEALPPGALPIDPPPAVQPSVPLPGIVQEGHKKFPSVTLSRGAISGIVLGAAASAFGVGSLAFLLIMPFSNRLNKRKSSEQMLPKTGNQWGSPSSPSSSSSMHSVPLHELE